MTRVEVAPMHPCLEPSLPVLVEPSLPVLVEPSLPVLVVYMRIYVHMYVCLNTECRCISQISLNVCVCVCVYRCMYKNLNV